MHGRTVQELIAPLLALAAESPSGVLRYAPAGEFAHGDRDYVLPRFVLRGPRDGGDGLRLGIFAAIHGDEPEGALALCEFLRELAARPALAHGYDIHAYPVCNPTGYEDGTRHSRAGCDLNREFWRDSLQPEVTLLERELTIHRFHGVVALHADDTADGLYAYARGATMTAAIAEPALAAAEAFLPRARGETIDGFPARRGVIRHCYAGVLGDPRELHPAPFDIIFETPQRTPVDLQGARLGRGAARHLARVPRDDGLRTGLVRECIAYCAPLYDNRTVKLSKRGEYALRAMIDLGIAQELGRSLLRIGELVEKENLPEKFLVQIFLQLREAGFVESRRGKHGGYLLARPMDSISFGQIVRLIDGPLAPIACCSQTAYSRCTCPDEEHCGLRMLMLDVRNAIADILDRYTLADVVGITLRKLRNDQASFHLGDVLPGVFETAGSDEPVLPRRTRRVARQTQPAKG